MDPEPVAKWKKSAFIPDTQMEQKDRRSTVLTVEEEAIAVAFRKRALLPLDDCLYALGHHPAPDALVLCALLSAPRHQRAPDPEGDKPAEEDVQGYPWAFSISTSPRSRPAPGKLFLFVAIDRASKFAFARAC